MVFDRNHLTKCSGEIIRNRNHLTKPSGRIILNRNHPAISKRRIIVDRNDVANEGDILRVRFSVFALVIAVESLFVIKKLGAEKHDGGNAFLAFMNSVLKQ
jgi:hypothetical protein